MVSRWDFDQFSNTVWTHQWRCLTGWSCVHTNAHTQAVHNIVIMYLQHYVLGIVTVVQWVFGIRHVWCCVLCTRSRKRCVLGTRPPVMRTEYCDHVLAALHVRYCDCCAMSLWHQVCPVLCIVYCVPGIRSVVYWVLGPCALDTTSRATAHPPTSLYPTLFCWSRTYLVRSLQKVTSQEESFIRIYLVS